MAVDSEALTTDGWTISQWANQELADEITTRGIVNSGLRNGGNLKLYLVRYWLTPTNDPAFNDKAGGICTLYARNARVNGARKTRLSAAELTEVELIEVTYPDLPTAPDLVRRRE